MVHERSQETQNEVCGVEEDMEVDQRGRAKGGRPPKTGPVRFEVYRNQSRSSPKTTSNTMSDGKCGTKGGPYKNSRKRKEPPGSGVSTDESPQDMSYVRFERTRGSYLQLYQPRNPAQGNLALVPLALRDSNRGYQALDRDNRCLSGV